MSLQELQRFIDEMYGQKDQARGIEGTFMWFMEEVGELAAALRTPHHPGLAHEFADVLAWLVTLANVSGVDLARAIHEKYGTGCPGCGQRHCRCPSTEKP
ncbi:MAG: nucleotide pyrophosphohydrolase [Planctomycetaceae bacterium]|nr:MAG: nucleotide pyrophosphohydrolase [Planctomycetaceae bacterium]